MRDQLKEVDVTPSIRRAREESRKGDFCQATGDFAGAVHHLAQAYLIDEKGAGLSLTPARELTPLLMHLKVRNAMPLSPRAVPGCPLVPPHKSSRSIFLLCAVLCPPPTAVKTTSCPILRLSFFFQRVSLSEGCVELAESCPGYSG